MKKRNKSSFLIIFLAATIVACNNKKENNMPSIEFIPKEFHDVKLGFNETSMNPCSPGYPEEFFPKNKIEINIPQKVIYRFGNTDTIRPVLPVCALYALSAKRISKYGYLPDKIYVLKTDNRKAVYSSEIYDNTEYESLARDPLAEEREKERQEGFREAQKYSDDELEDGFNKGWYKNVDILEYVDIPIRSGKYEVWMTAYNMESNHAIVEIVVE